MDKEELEEYLKDANDRIYEQLSYAEAKHAVLIGFLGAAIFSLIGIIIDLKEFNLMWLQVWIGVVAVLLLAPFVVSITALYPNRKTLKKKTRNLYFYGDISKFTDDNDYLTKVKDDADLSVNLANQNIQVSKIVTKKHDKFSLALNLCLASLFPIHYIGIIVLLILWHKQKR